MRSRRAAALAVTLCVLLVAGPAGADPPPVTVAYRPPVPGPVIDPYRPPTTPYGPGNRGIDYATTPGEPVGAPADGLVTFAGAVGGGLHVVVLHADGIRTSLSFLAAVLVRRGQRVVAGEPVGRAGTSVHLGARRGEAYLDPATLLGGGPAGGRAVLVPEGPGRPLGSGEEAAGLSRLLAGDRPAPVPTPAPAVAPRPRAGPGLAAPGAAVLRRAASSVASQPALTAILAASAVARRGDPSGGHGPARTRPGGSAARRRRRPGSRRRTPARIQVAPRGGGGYPVRSAGRNRAASTHRLDPHSPRHPTVAPLLACPAGGGAPTEGEPQAWPSSP